ncbi:unnamed protein product [Lepeophtheirus salmonis]|uniref:(salmon louse) hypothetical protein n=1 Tax=Lepeophtheirus salmonis TaxID=72036 RepID=A0A7R8CR56_LEPSM|nr:uncharacterized protein LOC121114228 isoform X1 [Lepeophtheirus salmonis]CAB4062279.1 unnamed protein product [Lepeophtheirus salmonis]CAF2899986.1 unnamed protein product [Lepeophtheirus salmonis]
MVLEDTGEDALIQYLTKEKIQSQYRLRSSMLFLQSINSGSTMVNESLEILRQNAESDYDCILHLLTLLRHNKSPKENEKIHGSVSPTEFTDNKNSNNSKPSIQNEFVIQDPLMEDFDDHFSGSYLPVESNNDDLIIEEAEDENLCQQEEDQLDHEATKENENSENMMHSSKIRYIKDKPNAGNLARSLPVNVPWPQNNLAKEKYEPEEDDIPEDIQSGLAYIMSLRNKTYDLPSSRYDFKLD